MKRRSQGNRSNICIECANSGGRCSWSRDFEPIPGWMATPIQIRGQRNRQLATNDSYRITDCPLFERRKDRS